MKDWQELQDKIGAWTNEAFPTSDLNGKMEHLKREAQEVIDSKGQDREEWADVTILLLDAAQKSGMSVSDLFNAAASKLEKNKLRAWSAPDKDGVRHHKCEGCKLANCKKRQP